MRQRKTFKSPISSLATFCKTTSSVLVTGGSEDEDRGDDGNTEEGAAVELIDDGVEASKLYAYMVVSLGRVGRKKRQAIEDGKMENERVRQKKVGWYRGL